MSIQNLSEEQKNMETFLSPSMQEMAFNVQMAYQDVRNKKQNIVDQIKNAAAGEESMVLRSNTLEIRYRREHDQQVLDTKAIVAYFKEQGMEPPRKNKHYRASISMKPLA